MKRVLLKSVFDCFEYVMDHYYPFSLEEFASAKDSYAIISIQDWHNGGYGFVFTENAFCKGVLTLYFDDVDRQVNGAKMFDRQQASQILDFISQHQDVDTLVIHCYAGQSRSRAVYNFVMETLGHRENMITGGNQQVYDLLKEVYEKRHNQGENV